ncbi:MAG TPA: hypothetical protein VGQ71_03430 [Terriglobales bacterium]|nr:hypothetical protein [Terriglobales bacterium]
MDDAPTRHDERMVDRGIIDDVATRKRWPFSLATRRPIRFMVARFTFARLFPHRSGVTSAARC